MLPHSQTAKKRSHERVQTASPPLSPQADALHTLALLQSEGWVKQEHPSVFLQPVLDHQDSSSAHSSGAEDNGQSDLKRRKLDHPELSKRAVGSRSEHYRCRRCGQPKKNHVCVALLNGTTVASEESKSTTAKTLVWTNMEDEIIFDGVEKFGYKWNLIAAALPGRTGNAVRNRWHRLHKSQRSPDDKLDADGEPPGFIYRCCKCGKPKRGHICTANTENFNPQSRAAGAAAGASPAEPHTQQRTLLPAPTTHAPSSMHNLSPADLQLCAQINAQFVAQLSSQLSSQLNHLASTPTSQQSAGEAAPRTAATTAATSALPTSQQPQPHQSQQQQQLQQQQLQQMALAMMPALMRASASASQTQTPKKSIAPVVPTPASAHPTTFTPTSGPPVQPHPSSGTGLPMATATPAPVVSAAAPAAKAPQLSERCALPPAIRVPQLPSTTTPAPGPQRTRATEEEMSFLHFLADISARATLEPSTAKHTLRSPKGMSPCSPRSAVGSPNSPNMLLGVH